MTSTDDLLYKELGVSSDASPNTIKHAYRRLALQYHPDKNPQGLENFKAISEAFQVLSNPGERKKYDAQGYQAVLHRDPKGKGREEDPESAVQAARDGFDDFMESLDEDVDQEIDDLLNWWTRPELNTSDAKACLRIDSDSFFDQLVAVYDQFRLTHHATTNDERSKTVTPAIERFVDDHFGAANRKRLHEWNTQSTLEPVMNGKYTAKNGDFVDAPATEPSRQLPPEVGAVHLQRTNTFETFLNFESKSASGRALKSLKNKHAKEYRKKWKALQERDKHRNYKEKSTWESFKKDVDWAGIETDLRELYELCNQHDQTHDVTAYKVAELKWQRHAQDYGFPAAWSGLVEKHVTSVAKVSYKKSSYKPTENGASSAVSSLQARVEDGDSEEADVENDATDADGDTRMKDTSGVDAKEGTGTTTGSIAGISASSAGDGAQTREDRAQPPASQDPTESPNTSITVNDGGEQRTVFGWRARGLGRQVFLTMTASNAKVAILEIVNARLWQRTLAELTKPEHDLSRMKVDRSFLKQNDYSDLTWIAIALQRRYEVPLGGFNNFPETQVVFRVKGDDNSGMKMATRSDLGAVYGKKHVDSDIWSIFERSKRKLPSKPTRKSNAIMFEEMNNGNDSESEDAQDEADADDPSHFNTDANAGPKLLTSTEEQQDPSMEEISDLLQKLMKGKRSGQQEQQVRQRNPRRRHKEKIPQSPVPANKTEAQLLEVEITDRQRRLDKYRQALDSQHE